MSARFQTKEGYFDMLAWRDTVESTAARFRRMGLDEAEVARRVNAYMDMVQGKPIVRNELRLEPVTTNSTGTRKPAKRQARTPKRRKPKPDSPQLNLFDDDPIGH